VPRAMSKHEKTLAALFAEPVRANIKWNDVVSLIQSLGAVVTEGEGSRVNFTLRGERIVLHKPHPEKEISKAAVRSLREFLIDAGEAP
jgi:hypothetical protein